MKKTIVLILILCVCVALPAIAQPNRAGQLQATYNQLVAQAKAQEEALEGLKVRAEQVLGMYNERVLADKEINALRKEIATLKKVKEETPKGKLPFKNSGCEESMLNAEPRDMVELMYIDDETGWVMVSRYRNAKKETPELNNHEWLHTGVDELIKEAWTCKKCGFRTNNTEEKGNRKCSGIIQPSE